MFRYAPAKLRLPLKGKGDTLKKKEIGERYCIFWGVRDAVVFS